MNDINLNCEYFDEDSFTNSFNNSNNICILQCGILADYLFTLNVKGTFPEVIPKCHNIGFLVLDTLCDNKLLLFINVAHGNGIYNHGLSSTTYTHYNITW